MTHWAACRLAYLVMRQRARSLSGGDLQPDLRSWGKVYIHLSDKISPAAQSAWREQLLCRDLRRLSTVPKMVMARQGRHGSGYRVVGVSPHLSPELAARAIIEGTCRRVSFEPSPLTCTLAEESLHSSDDLQREPVAERGLEVEGSRDTAADVIGTTSGGTSFRPADIPDRGFHLVHLPAVVRNYVEWSHCLPKVEPCFRVSDNRDLVLLGLLHTMGGRLLCSSKHDVRASLEATRRVVSSSSSPLPRLLDSHVCRPPALLRTLATARVGLFEVDCVDELLRVSAARRCVLQKGDRLHERARTNSRASVHPVPRFGEDTPAALIKLAYPVPYQGQGPGGAELWAGDESSTEHTLPALVQAAHGASIADVLEILQTLRKAPGMCQTGPCKAGDPGNIPVVGFSIDVGEACLRDSQLACSRRVETGTVSSARITPGEAVASETLARDIEAAIRFVKDVACQVEEAIASTDASVSDIMEASPLDGYNQDGGGDSTACLPPFSFRRLHVTGLGHGGARGEPLVALKTALSRHMSEARFGDVSNTHGVFSRPMMVSADATEHFMAGGVWSTVASVIGRREVALGTRRGGGNGIEVPTTNGERVNGPDSAVMYYIDDGCYGSLSGALLRGVPMHPTALSRGHRDFERDVEEQAPSASVPCIVWGPTCDGFDCVARVTPLPTDLEPGRDWLLFPERGMRGTADATGFNGLPHLDAFYCVHQQ